MITVKNLTKSFGTRTLWRNLNLTVPAGRMLALVGASGSGKPRCSTCIGLLERPSSGHILFDNTDLTRLGPGGRRRSCRDKLGYLFQDYALIDNATVKANLDVARRRGTCPDYARILERVGLVTRKRESALPIRWRTAARRSRPTQVKQPTLVLADEPTGP